MIRDERTVHFNFVVSAFTLVAESIGCPHNGEWEEGCRACRVQRNYMEAMMRPGCFCHWWQDEALDRHIAGHYPFDDDVARAAITDLQALVRLHADPVRIGESP